MNRQRFIRILIALSILYLVIWIGFVIWISREAKRNNWLVDKEADPAAAPLPAVSDDSWMAILANPNFASKSLNERIAIADQHFEKIKDVADGQGYDLKALQTWYQQTAADFERYPVQTFVFGQGMKTNYRDLRNSGFPKPSFWRIFWPAFLSKDAMLFALIGLPFVTIVFLLIVGIIIAVFSRSLSVKWRALVLALLAIILVEAWLIRYEKKHPVSLGLYTFSDNGNYISAGGTWTSDTKLAAPLQVTKLDCWRQWNHCIEATARIFDGSLSVDTSYWEIKNWGAEEITSNNDLALCKVEILRVDRKSKLVTYTNAPKRPQPDSCKWMANDPIVSHLVDGYKLRFD